MNLLFGIAAVANTIAATIAFVGLAMGEFAGSEAAKAIIGSLHMVAAIGFLFCLRERA